MLPILELDKERQDIKLKWEGDWDRPRLKWLELHIDTIHRARDVLLDHLESTNNKL